MPRPESDFEQARGPASGKVAQRSDLACELRIGDAQLEDDLCLQAPGEGHEVVREVRDGVNVS